MYFLNYRSAFFKCNSCSSGDDISQGEMNSFAVVKALHEFKDFAIIKRV